MAWQSFSRECSGEAQVVEGKRLRTWHVASGFGSLCGVAIILPIQEGMKARQGWHSAITVRL